ncbi:hypothetical protein Ancab_033232 [Ancistrocladus abbreviatus]
MADHANSTGLSQGAKDGGGDGNDHINIENFTERLRSFYFHWREHKAELWADCGVLAIATPPPSKSWALNMWLLGYEFPETLMVLSEKQIHFLCSQNKASLLDVIKKAVKEAVGVDVVMHVKAKGDDGTHQMDAILRAIRSDNNPVVGYLAKEAHEGDLIRTWTEKLKNSNLRLIDTSNGLSDLLTEKGVSYRFNEEDKEEQKYKVKPEVNDNDAILSGTTFQSVNEEELGRQLQAEHAHQKNEETAWRLAGASIRIGDDPGVLEPSNELIAYKNVDDLPPRWGMLGIRIDSKNKAILLPFYGSMVPFHISTIKTVDSMSDTNYNSYVKIIFNNPGNLYPPHDANNLKHQDSIFVKDVSFYSIDSKGMVEQIEKLQQEFDTAEREALITEENLVLARDKSRTIKLSNLCIQPCPPCWGRQIPGTLEAHVNGFRYYASKPDQQVDFMFGNIKHAVFQPADNEMKTLLHFHLYKRIMVGNRITANHVQFYREVMEVGETLGGWRRSADEPVEIEGEHGEREGKNKINEEFEIFISLLNDLWIQPQFKGLGLKFDRPLRDLGFYGVHAGATEFIVPAAACLIKLTYPLLVITLSEIAMVSLERVGCGQKNFDMVIVFKDLKRNVFQLKSIPTTSLERIKGWLDSIDIKHYESRINLRWRPILKTIMVEPHLFIEDGEWDFLNMDRSDSDSEKSDKDYEPSDVEAESEPDDGDSNSESLAFESSVESEDDEEDSEEDLEEEEMTWSEWEEATNADREVGNKSNSEGKRRRMEMKALGKSRGVTSSSSSPKRAKLV